MRLPQTLTEYVRQLREIELGNKAEYLLYFFYIYFILFSLAKINNDLHILLGNVKLRFDLFVIMKCKRISPLFHVLQFTILFRTGKVIVESIYSILDVLFYSFKKAPQKGNENSVLVSRIYMLDIPCISNIRRNLMFSMPFYNIRQKMFDNKHISFI